MSKSMQINTRASDRKSSGRLASIEAATTRPRPRPATHSARMGPVRLAAVVACSLCLIACLMPARPVECGRLQDFLQNLVGGGGSGAGSSSSNSNNSNKDGNSNSNSNSNSNNNDGGDSNDSDTAASNDSNEQPLTPMMSAMNPFMRYPSFYDSFNPASFGAGGYPGMSAFSGPMAGAMSAMSPMAAMSSNSLSGAFSPSAFSPASFASSFGSSGAAGSGNPLSAFGGAGGMSASSLNNVYAQSTPSNAFMGGYSPYYGRRR